MTEAYFVQNNLSRLEAIEKEIKGETDVSPDRLVQIYAELSDDLALAQTQFAEADITTYLNGLVSHLHRRIHVNKKTPWSKVQTFWTRTVPETSYRHRRKIYTSLLIFAVSVLIGALSAENDPLFARSILGDRYVNMTEANIEKGDPLAVYKGNAHSMFAMITVNNIRVSFMAFIAGLFWSVGTGFLLLQNGIMLGVFHHLFYQNNLLLTSILTVWIHGTLEISAIVIAGGAGFVLGNGVLFPGTHTRLRSVQMAAKDGARLIAGLVPIFIMAGFLESYVTRLTESPEWFKIFVIALSAGWIVFYFFIYPKRLAHHGKFTVH